MEFATSFCARAKPCLFLAECPIDHNADQTRLALWLNAGVRLPKLST